MSVRRTLAAVLAAGVLLAGCSDEPEPRFEPTESPSPSESESSSAEPEAQSPEESIREWFALNVAMQNTGKTAAFLEASRNCISCDGLAQRVERIYARGGYIQVDSQEVLKIKPGSRSATIKQFEVTVRTAPTEFRESDSAAVDSLPGGTVKYRMTLVYRADQWLMESVVAA